MSNMQHVIELLRTATTYAQVFGVLSGDAGMMKRELRRAYATLAKTVHPDFVSADQRSDATDAMQMLTILKKNAVAAIVGDRYDRPFAALGVATSEIRSSIDVYVVPETPQWIGDYSATYIARRKSDDVPVKLKIARTPKHNGSLEHEDQITRDLVKKKVPYVECPIDSFLILNGSMRLRVTVYLFDEEMLSLAEIRDRIGTALDPLDAAWIWRRIIGQVMAAHQGGLVHGAITPGHVLVHPATHDVRHIGWAQAVPPGRCIARPDAIWCAPEMLIDEPVDERSDIFMAGGTMLFLIDNQLRYLPRNIAATLKWATKKDPADRPRCGADLMDKLTADIRQEWGQHYRQLTLP